MIDGSYLERGARIDNWASSLQTELFAILLALKQVSLSKTNTLIVTDSLSSLSALNSFSTKNNLLVSEARHRYNKLNENRIKVHFLWIPSHVGLRMHDRTDELAKTSSFKNDIDYNFGISINTLRGTIRKENRENFLDLRNTQYHTSLSIQHHSVMQEEPHIYGSSKYNGRLLDVVTARLRLGYKYLWQVKPSPDIDETKCKLCEQTYSHTLKHYVLECDKIQEFRDPNIDTVIEMSKYFISNNLLAQILAKHPNFASNM